MALEEPPAFVEFVFCKVWALGPVKLLSLRPGPAKGKFGVEVVALAVHLVPEPVARPGVERVGTAVHHVPEPVMWPARTGASMALALGRLLEAEARGLEVAAIAATMSSFRMVASIFCSGRDPIFYYTHSN